MTSLILLLLLIFQISSIETIEHQFSWNSSNSIFRISDRPEIEVRIGDVVRFVCPDDSSNEYLTIYEVGELAFDDCVMETTSREILRCGQESTTEKALRSPKLIGNEPTTRAKNVAQVIRQLNPVPTGKEFQPGQTYYYMTTSTGKLEGIDKQSRGLCETANMRLTMRVLPPAPVTTSTPGPSGSTRQRQDTRNQWQQNLEAEEAQEDEDSENDDVIPTHPKFRRPSELHQAGVEDQQFLKVIQMAKEGRTGTFENNAKDFVTSPAAGSAQQQSSWDPINVEFVSSIMQKTYSNANEDLTYQREEPDFVIHEDNNVRSLEYSSSTPTTTLMTSLLVTVVLLLL